jgi:hypothetical protein
VFPFLWPRHKQARPKGVNLTVNKRVPPSPCFRVSVHSKSSYRPRLPVSVHSRRLAGEFLDVFILKDLFDDLTEARRPAARRIWLPRLVCAEAYFLIHALLSHVSKYGRPLSNAPVTSSCLCKSPRNAWSCSVLYLCRIGCRCSFTGDFVARRNETYTLLFFTQKKLRHQPPARPI